MILHPGVFALIIGATITLLLLSYASFYAVVILFKWDSNSSSEAQLALERRTYLLSTIMRFAMLLIALSAILFIYTADNIHTLFIGAMCATGSLQANPVGWNLLLTKLACLFVSLFWLVLNNLDQQAEDYPLVKLKYSMLLALSPLVCADSYFLIRYFSALRPNIITSCCGALFSEGAGAAGSLAALPVKPMMIAFYLVIGIFMVCSLMTLLFNKRFLRVITALIAPALLVVSLSAVISFVCLYFYEIPTHHCPFDLLQKEYNFIGYPLYSTLFAGVLLGMVPGMVEPLKKIPSLEKTIKASQRRWTLLSILCISAFGAICSWPILFSSFSLAGFY